MHIVENHEVTRQDSLQATLVRGSHTETQSKIGTCPLSIHGWWSGRSVLFSGFLFCQIRIPLVRAEAIDSCNDKHLCSKGVLLFWHGFVSLCLFVICVCCSSSVSLGPRPLFASWCICPSCERLQQGLFQTPLQSRLCASLSTVQNLKFASNAPNPSLSTPTTFLDGYPSMMDIPLHYSNHRKHYVVTHLTASYEIVGVLAPHVDCDTLTLTWLLLPLPNGHDFAQ